MLPINTIYCIGRNYVAHIAELNSETPTEPLIFLKPNSSILAGNVITLPAFSQNVHYETELVVQIGQDCEQISPENALSLISAYAVGWDLTAIEFTLTLNGEPKQHGNTSLMIDSLPFLISYLADLYGLKRGDIVFTGTPAGVGQLHSGDVLELDLHHGLATARFEVA